MGTEVSFQNTPTNAADDDSHAFRKHYIIVYHSSRKG